MARNGSGVQSSPGASYPAVASTLIESAKYNAVVDDINSVLTTSLSADGQTTVTGNQSMNSFKHTSLLNGTARADNTALGQLQDGVLNWVAAGGTVDAITATYSPAITALIDGQVCCVRSAGANTSATPTFSPNGLLARTIVKNGGGALVAGNIGAIGHEFMLRYNLVNLRWELLNSASNQNLTGHVTSVGNAAVLGSFTSAQLLAALTDETGTGAAVFASSPTLVTPNIGVASGTSLAVTGLITSSSPTAGIGYAVGSGSSVVQVTSIASSVTINTISGKITTVSNAWTALAAIYVTVNNSTILATDTIAIGSQGPLKALIQPSAVANGSFVIQIYPLETVTNSLVINFAANRAAIT